MNGAKKRIRNAYKFAGSSNFYDGMMDCSTLFGKFMSRIVWDMNEKECAEYVMRALSGIPKKFSGRMLEVPVGTGVLTMPPHKTIPDAEIVCLDYSPEMMAKAEEKAKLFGIENIEFIQGDVGNLPFEDESFDIVLSLNGFCAFPDKEAAYKETFRVLKKGGVFCGGFYVEGNCKRTDFIIRHIYQPMEFFTPPYETMESVNSRFKKMYEHVKLSNVKSVACFVCRK